MPNAWRKNCDRLDPSRLKGGVGFFWKRCGKCEKYIQSLVVRVYLCISHSFRRHGQSNCWDREYRSWRAWCAEATLETLYFGLRQRNRDCWSCRCCRTCWSRLSMGRKCQIDVIIHFTVVGELAAWTSRGSFTHWLWLAAKVHIL